MENLIVRLTGNSSGLSAMYSKAEQESTRAAKVIEANGNRIEGIGTAIKGFAAAAVSALGAFGIEHWLREGIHAWAEQEDAILKTTAVMKANGTYTAELMRDYDEFSSAVQDVTRHADETTLALLAQAESFGLTGDAAKSASRSAIAFAEINGGSAQAYLRFTAAMQRGDTEMMKRMARMIPQLRGIKDESELVAKAQRLVTAGWELAQQRAQTFTGQVDQLKNAYSDFMEDVGKITGDVIKPLVTGVKDVVNWFKSWDESNKKILVYVALVAGGVLSAVTALATLKAVGAPIVAFIASGFSAIGSAIAAIGSGPLLAIAAVLAIVGTATYKWVQSVGGVGNAWDIVKTKALAAWDWVQNRADDTWALLRPFFDWLGSIWDEYSGSALTAVQYVWDKIAAFIAWVRPIFLAWFGFWKAQWAFAWEITKTTFDTVMDIFRTVDGFVQRTFGGWGELFRSVFGGATLDIVGFGGDFQAILRDAFILGEFLLRNFGQVWQLAMATVAYKSAEAFNAIGFFFSGTIPALLSYFTANWSRIWRGAFQLVVDGFTELSLPGLIRAMMRGEGIADIGRRIRQSISSAFGNMPPLNLPVRAPTETENQLRQEFERLAQGLGESWANFRERRLREIAATDPQRVREMRNSGHTLGDNWGDGFVRAVLKQLEKFDAALVGSAESATRLFSHYLMLTGRLGGEGRPNELGGEAGNDATRNFNFARGGASGAGGFGGGGGGAQGSTAPPSVPGTQAQSVTVVGLRDLHTLIGAILNILNVMNARDLQRQPQAPVQLNFVPADLP